MLVSVTHRAVHIVDQRGLYEVFPWDSVDVDRLDVVRIWLERKLCHFYGARESQRVEERRLRGFCLATVLRRDELARESFVSVGMKLRGLEFEFRQGLDEVSMESKLREDTCIRRVIGISAVVPHCREMRDPTKLPVDRFVGDFEEQSLVVCILLADKAPAIDEMFGVDGIRLKRQGGAGGYHRHEW
jgi:hypothetical protein